MPGATHYRLERGDTAMGPWSIVDAAIRGTSHKASGLTCATTYSFRVSARGDGTTYSIFFGTPSATRDIQTLICPLQTPEGLDLTPLPERKARLSWDPVPNAIGYMVEVRKVNTDWQSPRNESTAPLRLLSDIEIGAVTTNDYEINLDAILNAAGKTATPLFHGLAHDSSYLFRVKAIGRMNIYDSSDYSETTAIVDTPIIGIDGDSRGRTANDGQAMVKWTTPPGIPVYAVRHRKLSGDHTDVAWDTEEARSASDWREPPTQPSYDQTNPCRDGAPNNGLRAGSYLRVSTELHGRGCGVLLRTRGVRLAVRRVPGATESGWRLTLLWTLA